MQSQSMQFLLPLSSIILSDYALCNLTKHYFITIVLIPALRLIQSHPVSGLADLLASFAPLGKGQHRRRLKSEYLNNKFIYVVHLTNDCLTFHHLQLAYASTDEFL